MGIDPLLHGARAVMKIEETLLPKNIIIKAIEKNPIDKIWTENRPLIPDGKLRIHPADYAGKSLDQKLIEIRKILVENEVSTYNSFFLIFITFIYVIYLFICFLFIALFLCYIVVHAHICDL